VASYDLSGTFVECCDCFTICPCWVSDIPDENHCSGLYVWTFDAGSKIGGKDVGGKSVAAASYHGLGVGGQAVLFIDSKLKKMERDRLATAFSGLSGGDLVALSKLLGSIIAIHPAAITAMYDVRKVSNEKGVKKDTKVDTFDVAIAFGEKSAPFVTAKGEAKYLDYQDDPMTVENSALQKELGIRGVTEVQKMESLAVDVATMPIGPYVFKGRSGMRGRFHYSGNAVSSSRPLAAKNERAEA
jgi:hypothetical protein